MFQNSFSADLRPLFVHIVAFSYCYTYLFLDSGIYSASSHRIIENAVIWSGRIKSKIKQCQIYSLSFFQLLRKFLNYIFQTPT